MQHFDIKTCNHDRRFSVRNLQIKQWVLQGVDFYLNSGINRKQLLVSLKDIEIPALEKNEITYDIRWFAGKLYAARVFLRLITLYRL